MKLFKIMVISFSSLLVLGVIAFVLVLNMGDTKKASGERSIDDIVDSSYTTEEITTDLESGDYVRISFRIVADSKDTVKELEKRDFQVQNILLKELAVMDAESFQSGLSDLEATLKLKLNEFMDEGSVTDVYTVTKVLQ
ncbi:flagellar basal body-associated protein FliL [Halobacillus sp. ACCC02827]|uniref:flagellar basal body-associated protein FliL n=1 Tax=Bacillaceae TaxID=186817 RepID=UPI0002A4D9A4|nr:MULTISPECIES: flagellar basal body-associated protein FliL [Bacillaceae]ELK44749.1 flagellar basal body-associated protein FliL [Halobacillus sp. BAB-2008]QHT46664.1 flagellar basal body-associated protein FliL [Bacillus sp. SB49]WJE17475.1 flagellar basal body-associated protein FliL [Halobacillus sp. ACCC02827]